MGGILNLGTRRELFVDTRLIERQENTSLKLHEPVSGGVSIRLDRPWEGPANGGQAVLEFNGRYYMYYRGMNIDPGNESCVLCVAVSDDGVNWIKPKLGLVDYAGNKNNNIVAAEDSKALPVSTPWLDTRPGVPEDQRIKAITSVALSGEEHTAFKDPNGPKRLVFWGSSDGFLFRKLDPQPSLVSHLKNCFDGGNTMFWSEAEQQYLLYYRWFDDEDWSKGKRTMARTTSRDLMQWTEPVAMTYGGTPREQFYINNTTPYFRAPHIYIAPAARFMQGRRVVTDQQVKAIGLKECHGHFYGNDCSDAVLLTSRAGSTQYDRTFMEAFIRPGLGPSNWVSRTNYPFTGIFPFSNDQMMLYITRNYMQDSWHTERLLLRLDGFVSVTAPWSGGEFLSKPFTFDGKELEINYSTSAAGSINVEIQDDHRTAVPGFSLDECPDIIGDEIARTVAWGKESDVSCLAGKPVRLRFLMRDADIFSFKFS